MSLTLSAAVAQAVASTLATEIGSNPTIRIYSGARPATPETATTNQVLLSIVSIVGPFVAADGILTAENPTPALIDASGTASWFRVFTSDAEAVLDGEITVRGEEGDMTLVTLVLPSGAYLDLDVPTILFSVER